MEHSVCGFKAIGNNVVDTEYSICGFKKVGNFVIVSSARIKGVLFFSGFVLCLPDGMSVEHFKENYNTLKYQLNKAYIFNMNSSLRNSFEYEAEKGYSSEFHRKFDTIEGANRYFNSICYRCENIERSETTLKSKFNSMYSENTQKNEETSKYAVISSYVEGTFC